MPASTAPRHKPRPRAHYLRRPREFFTPVTPAVCDEWELHLRAGLVALQAGHQPAFNGLALLINSVQLALLASGEFDEVIDDGAGALIRINARFQAGDGVRVSPGEQLDFMLAIDRMVAVLPNLTMEQLHEAAGRIK